MDGDFSDKTPNAETLAAMAEIEAGGGETFEDAAGAVVAAILAAHDQRDALEEWFPMKAARLDRFARYRLADGSGELRGCIDAVSPRQVWIPERHHYLPIVHFNGWKPLAALQQTPGA